MLYRLKKSFNIVLACIEDGLIDALLMLFVLLAGMFIFYFTNSLLNNPLHLGESSAWHNIQGQLPVGLYLSSFYGVFNVGIALVNAIGELVAESFRAAQVGRKYR